jgi:pyruvate dehydrogenase (quinone)
MVLHNNDLNQVTWEMRAFEGDPKFETSQDVPDFPYAQYAGMLGLKGIRVDQPDQVRPAWEEAFAADRPVVLDVITDPDVPPLPPHISFEHTKAYLFSLLKGDPDEAGIIKQTIKGVADTILPHR